MIVGLDSAQPPTAEQARAARAAGIGLWSGYLSTRPQVGLFHAWTQSDFDNARLCGGIPIAFCSGWDDPAACRQLAQQWNVRLCLDVEPGIRGDGPWVQPWLDLSGAGLYGLMACHTGRRAAFHVLAWYTQNAGSTWPGQRPPTPCGWQWENSHNEVGVTVDRGWYDDWFATGGLMDPELKAFLDDIMQGTGQLRQWIYQSAVAAAQIPALQQELNDIKAELATLKGIPPGTTFTAVTK